MNLKDVAMIVICLIIGNAFAKIYNRSLLGFIITITFILAITVIAYPENFK